MFKVIQQLITSLYCLKWNWVRNGVHDDPIKLWCDFIVINSLSNIYDTTKKLAGRYGKLERSVKEKEGKSITEIQEQKNRWVEHFEEILN